MLLTLLLSRVTFSRVVLVEVSTASNRPVCLLDLKTTLTSSVSDSETSETFLYK